MILDSTDFSALRPLRIGCVRYLNSRPLIEAYAALAEPRGGIGDDGGGIGAPADGSGVIGAPANSPANNQITYDHPSALATELAAGRLDAALVPVFEVLRDPRYTIADGVAVACDGPVFSVVLAHRQPLADIRRVTLDPASRTSAHLLQSLLAEAHGLRPLYVPESDAQPDDARLVIGNQAIDFRLAAGPDWQFLDLGTAWRDWTGLPFVFAVWALRPALGNETAIADAFRALRDAGLARLDQIIAADPHYTPELRRRYLTEHIRFHLGPRERDALQRYRELLHRMGFIADGASALRFV